MREETPSEFGWIDQGDQWIVNDEDGYLLAFVYLDPQARAWRVWLHPEWLADARVTRMFFASATEAKAATGKELHP